jgi:hypothetical protein
MLLCWTQVAVGRRCANDSGVTPKVPLAWWVIAVALVACTSPPAAPIQPVRAIPTRCDYAVVVEPPAMVAVTVSCDAPLESLIASEAAMANHVQLTVGGQSVPRKGAMFHLPSGTREVVYRIDLERVAAEHHDIDVALEASDGERSAWIAAVSTWILRPHPIAMDTLASIDVTPAPGMGFATGLPKVDNRFELRAREIRFATYAVFGEFASTEFELEGRSAAGAQASVELVTVPGHLVSNALTRAKWVRDTASAISEFWHGFPVSHALVVLIPTPGHRGVAHGKVVAAGGPGVAIHIGAEAERDDLYGDWILVHELFHLGFPSFSGEGKWLDEGLATYFEPIIRARAGWRTPHAVWSEFAADMDQGLPAVESTGVENTTNFRGIYWGGAILALLADVETRRRTAGKLGLEDGLLAVLDAGGNASELWKLDHTIDVIDKRLGGDTLRKLADAHRFGGRPVDLPRLWLDLGIQREASGVSFDETATLATVRQAIIVPP